MTVPIDTSKLPVPATKIVDGTAPMPLRQMAAKGIAPGLKPADALTVVVLLAASADEALATAARATLDKLPPPLLNGALTPDLAPGALDAIAPRYASDAAVMEKVLLLPQLAPETVVQLAATANEAVCELIATNEVRLLAHPAIVEKLYMNKATRMSTADRVLELAVRNHVELAIPAFREAAAAIVDELIAEASPEPTPDDELFKETEEAALATDFDPEHEDTHTLDAATGEEVVEKKFQTVQGKLASMTISQRIRRAILGTATERSILVRDRNKLVAQAAIRSPMIQENEVVRISASRQISEDVLRIIANDKQWAGSHQIKFNLVTNPRCPFVFASRLVGHLREHELKAIAKSKNVSGAIAKAAKQQLERKK